MYMPNTEIQQTGDLYSEDYESQKLELVKPDAKLKDVVELCINGNISYRDATNWCEKNDISSGQFDRWLYKACLHPGKEIQAEPESWRHRLVSFLKRGLDALLNSILEVFT